VECSGRGLEHGDHLLATGNPSPGGGNVKVRTPVYPSTKYTNLYTDSILAINSSTGKLVWHFQMVPGDQRDYDQGMPVQLFTTSINGQRMQVVGAGSKIGYYFVVNAKTGALLYKVKLGIHENENATQGTVKTSMIYPGSDGGIDSFSAYNPNTNMIYTTAYNEPQSCDLFSLSSPRNATFYAINATTGSIVWSKVMVGNGLGGGASTTTDIVFTASGNNTFYAFNALSGQLLWSRSEPTGGGLSAYWSWGAPSITDGMVFETTMGLNGVLEAFSL
jgi:alcohol dehydrogenase (cytochrome c)